MVLGADINCHVGEGNRGDEEVMGRRRREQTGVRREDKEGKEGGGQGQTQGIRGVV